jgi:hypothetical protein
VGSPARGAAFGRVVCSLPLVAVASALAVAWVALGAPGGALVFGVALGVAMGAIGAWGSPPWTSRWLGHAVEHTRRRRIALAVVAATAFAAAIVALSVTDQGSGRTALVMVTLAGAQVDVAMAAVAVRQWRFAPRRRTFDASVLTLAGCGLLVGYPVLGLDGRISSVVLLVVLLVPVLVVAWPLGALADRAALRRPRRRDHDREDQRMPESRNASA